MSQPNFTRRQGLLTTNGVILEKHEAATINFFLALGKNIELIRPSLTPHSKNADFVMDSVIWEMKSPQRAAKRSIERMFYEATRQSSNIVIDLRRINRGRETVVTLLQICFKTTRKIRRLYLVTSDKEYRYLQK